MCGIVGYIGDNKAAPILINGIKRLEYRGYDSSGISIIENDTIQCEKSVGFISELEKKVNGKFNEGTLGIVHTRWATHGAPTIENAHPHIDCTGKISIVHNGIIENYNYLKTKLEKEGHIFKSETDSEVLAHLIESCFEGVLEDAVRTALKEVEGAYGLAIISLDDPGKLVAARRGSPLIVGIGEREHYVASDVAAILEYTKEVVYLDDNEIAVLTRDNLKTTDINNVPITKRIDEVQWNLDKIEKGGYEHFMLKEIYEQPQSLHDAMLGRFEKESNLVHLGGLKDKEDDLRNIRRIIIVACGTSWHAGLIGEYMIEEHLGIPVEVEYASEFRYRNPVIEASTMVIAISQSGETADTLAAIHEARKKGAIILSICNVVGSSIAREADCGIFLHAGPEIGVASTKAFTSQIAVLCLLTLFLARIRKTNSVLSDDLACKLKEIPKQVQTILDRKDQIAEIAQLYSKSDNILYLGRGYNYPVALEGALKLKEISYIHAEGYPAAEMKHGPIALIDKNMPVVFVATTDNVYAKILSNIEEVRARGGRVIAIASEGNCEISEMVDHVIFIPETIDALVPILSTIPLQLLAYHMAVMRGCDVDKPRNLAKSVTVE
ncbi:MAG: glutamine--fructose-6-phosphate transaminase (isomerizing) [Candidatus Scalindua sp.]|mgnify:CR=1 FL=1|jgi:glucosamine--fructose-6-phosphate aminotransferase (isomerizing)|nr:glutamine--fructose-6-phosphate transaminase (isomerizing) [Candidatus Scalindua sp.]MBT5306508.1 glutamine--fructose-6-phosphate transaminase (isomerizing) [Candidatus Scalindua sp.]MBT6226922.1 glutamine--fructose-6-phosphate transaminase (isomerizing) [Candidatus Scalindua sp.]MBT7213089.1 glutamine--fructose-6-phosphate transaminase (isomerizing) [Candidatus Scalindua sp.]